MVLTSVPVQVEMAVARFLTHGSNPGLAFWKPRSEVHYQRACQFQQMANYMTYERMVLEKAGITLPS
jgi:hypothetical protein